MGKRRGRTDITGVVNELTSGESGVVVFASSTGNQYSVEDPAWRDGAFTKAVVEGITGRADYTGQGKITINMLDLIADLYGFKKYCIFLSLCFHLTFDR
jgi:hypothetical protein